MHSNNQGSVDKIIHNVQLQKKKLLIPSQEANFRLNYDNYDCWAGWATIIYHLNT